MFNKILILLVAFFGTSAIAQNTIHSPYSSYGFGEKTYSVDAISLSLGTATNAYVDSTIVNFSNPASYNSYSKGFPLFSLGLRSRVSFFKQDDLTQLNAVAMVDHFVMAIPVKKYFGFAVGLRPFSRRGYQIVDGERAGADTLRYVYQGGGGANEVFVGFSSTIFNLKKTGSELSFGANMGYLFGNVYNSRKSNIVNEEIGGAEETSLRFQSFHYEIGAYFKQNIGKFNSFSLSAVVEPSQKINAFQSKTLYYASNIENQNSYVALYDTSNVKGYLNLAPSYTIGFSYSLKTKFTNKKMQEHNGEFKFFASFTSSDWTRFSENFNGSTVNHNFTVTNKVAVGLQFNPEYKLEENKVNTSFLASLRYRAGYYFYNLPYSSSNGNFKEQAVTFGFGIPLAAQKVLSSVNLGFALGMRNDGATTGYQEKFIGINLGVIIAPSNFDMWFRKRKLD
ncbi:MAG: hypothetical protein V4638_01780 [Bacteroidota bacterium]